MSRTRRTSAAGVVLAAAVALGVAALLPDAKDVEDAPVEPAARTDAPRLEGAEAETPRPAPEVATASTAPKTERVHGTLRVGGVAPARFTVQVEGDLRRQSPFPIEGIDGAFDADGVPAGRTRLRVVRIDGRDVDLPLARGAGDLQSLQVDEPIAASLDVVDRETKKPLSAARVLRWDGPDLRTGVAPPFDRRRTYGRNHRGAGRDGRIALPASVGRAIWIVVEDLHAWKAVEVRYGEQETQTVELDPGARAHIAVLGWRDVETDGRLRFLGGDGEEPLPRPDPDGSVWLDGIPLGRYEVLLRTGAQSGEVRARADLDATRLGESEVRLDARDGARAPHRIVLTLDYGKEWGERVGSVADRISAHFTALDAKGVYEDAPLEDPAEPDRAHRISSQPLPPGKYRVELVPFGWRGEATIVDSDVHLVASVPPPGWLVCETGAPGHVSVWWRQVGKGTAYVGDASRPIRVFPGRLVTWGKATGYRQSEERTVEVGPGQRVRVAFDLEREQRLVVTIRDRAGPVADLPWTALLETHGSAGRIVERHSSGTSPSVEWHDVSASSAVVRIEPPAGYATPDEQMIILRGGANEVVFDLEKNP